MHVSLVGSSSARHKIVGFRQLISHLKTATLISQRYTMPNILCAHNCSLPIENTMFVFVSLHTGIHVGRQKPKRVARRVLTDVQFRIGDHHVRSELGSVLPRHAIFHHLRFVHNRHSDHRLRVPTSFL